MAAPLLQQLVGAVEVDLGLVELRLLRLDAGVERLRLQHQLRVGDGQRAPRRLGAVAFLRFERDDRAAEPRAGDELVDRLDGGDDRLLVLDLDRVDDKRIGRECGLGQGEAAISNRRRMEAPLRQGLTRIFEYLI